jgi:multidrug resistance efflux pump
VSVARTIDAGRTEAVSVPVAARDEPTPARPARRPRTAHTVSRVLFIVVAVAVVAQVAGLGGSWLFYNRFYVSTGNAQVDGDRIDIRAPRAGTVTGWAAGEGAVVRGRQVVGHIRQVGDGPRVEETVRAPAAGTVVLTDVVDGAYVVGGAVLASAYDLEHTYVTARVDDDEIADVHPGAPVRVAVDAFPGTTFVGVVADVQASTAGVMDPNPPPGVSRSNPPVVNQYVPVRIWLLGTGGHTLMPGMNVTVHIRRT